MRFLFISMSWWQSIGSIRKEEIIVKRNIYNFEEFSLRLWSEN